MTPRATQGNVPPAIAAQIDAFTTAVQGIAEGAERGTEASHAADAAIRAAYAVSYPSRRSEGWSTEFSSSFAGIIGQRVKELRAEAGWTQASLADAMKPYFKWTRITVAEVETEARRLTLEELLLLAALFGEPMVSFLIPTDNTWLELPSRDIPPTHLQELLVGIGGAVGRGGADWAAASQIATDTAARPAIDRWRRRPAGTGQEATPPSPTAKGQSPQKPASRLDRPTKT